MIDRIDAHEDHCLKVLDMVKKELKDQGFSASDYEKVLVEEFYACVEEGLAHEMRNIDPDDKKQIKGYVNKVIERIQRE